MNQGQTYSDDQAHENRQRPIFWIFFWLAVACLVAKIYYLNSLYPFFQHNRKKDWLENLSAITQGDMAFVVIAAMISALLLLITSPFRRAHRLLHALIRLFAILCLAYIITAA